MGLEVRVAKGGWIDNWMVKKYQVRLLMLDMSNLNHIISFFPGGLLCTSYVIRRHCRLSGFLVLKLKRQ